MGFVTFGFYKELTFQLDRFYRHKRTLRTARVWSCRDKGENCFMQTGAPIMLCVNMAADE